jgi:hypothetical protein
MPPEADPVVETTEVVTKPLEETVTELRRDVDELSRKVDEHVVHPVVTEPVEKVAEVKNPVVEEVKEVVPAPPREETPKEEVKEDKEPSHGLSRKWFG